MHLHIDAGCGAAGDMLLAACLDLGVAFDALKERLAALEVPGYSMECFSVERCGMAAKHLVIHDLHEAPGHGHSHGPHRHLKDLLGMVSASPFSDSVKSRATACFRTLAEAEGAVHGKSPEEVHFHEVSGIDTLLDVVGACLALEMLGVTDVTCWPVAVGSGTIRCAHGVLPVPAPATLAILKRHAIPYQQRPVEGELLTPTGAALLGVLVDRFEPSPAMTCRAIGYGAGSREYADHPNLLRAVLGDTAAGCAVQAVQVLTAAIDDMTPEAIAFCMEQCFAAGAVDAYATPVVMKKNRPGVELTVLVELSKAHAVEEAFLRSSSTFGFRRQRLDRTVLERDWIDVILDGTPIRVKRGVWKGEVLRLQPEFEDCKGLAEKQGVAVDTVMHRAYAAAQAVVR